MSSIAFAKPVNSTEVLALADQIYGQYLSVLSCLFRGGPNIQGRLHRYRLGLTGDLPMSNVEQRQLLFDFGRDLGRTGIDLVIATEREDSAVSWVAKGFVAAQKEYLRGRVIANNFHPASCWLGGGDHIRYYSHRSLSSAFEFLSGFATDIACLTPDMVSNVTVAEFWQRYQFQRKIPLNRIPDGLRLSGSSVDVGWDPQCLCVGPQWEWLKMAQQTFVKHRTLNPDNKEHQAIGFIDGLSQLLTTITDRALKFMELTGNIDQSEKTRVHSAFFNRRAQKLLARYFSLMKQMIPSQLGHFRVAVWGSHHRPESCPSLAQARELGRFLGENGIDEIDGNGGPGSVMGQAAIGHREGRQSSGLSALGIGISLGLPWEDGNSQPDTLGRHKITRHGALNPRLDGFFSRADDFCLLMGGPGTLVEFFKGLDRARLCNRPNPYALPFGRRLLTESVRYGWVPRFHAVGDPSFWKFIDHFKKTMFSLGVFDTAHGDYNLVDYHAGMDSLKQAILTDRARWRDLLLRGGVKPKN